MRSHADPQFARGEREYQPVEGQIVWVETYTDDDKLFVIDLPDGIDLDHEPGQFVQLFVPGVGEAPFSIASSPTKDGPFELCIRAVGNVTNAIHDLESGDTVGIRGPYGTGFDVDALAGEDLLFVAGGIGLAPLRSIINYALDRPGEFGELTTLYGCTEPAEQLFPDELAAWADSPIMDYHETVDGVPAGQEWDGNTGVITSLIPPLDFDPATTVALVCGPPVMYRFVIKSLRENGLPDERIYLSLERNMHCGRGLCGHCQLNELYVCLDGPVFNYTTVRDKEEAEV
ncbi:FAD/NAD(P)-binding protein [Halorhabdus salina]|uniref:FAD/NAD(P)-binding protein n=1 Tax=Halorhabdus salina TaxID=2750670 RepID=UPI0015EEA1E0|nr:FAD/NAD(P)-binding protein [Halorhabdus salina]